VSDADPHEADADPAAGRVRSRLATFRRHAGTVLSIPLWLIVPAIGLLLLGAWVWPYDFEAASRPRQAVQTLGFLVRVFQFHLALLLLAALVLGLVLGRRRLALLAVLAAVPVVAAEAWHALPASAPARGSGEVLRVMSINAYAFNRDAHAITAEVRRVDPDVLVFQEFTLPLHGRLIERLGGDYPHRLTRPAPGARGKAVFSKRPIDADLGHPNAGSDGRRRFAVELDGRPVAIALVHHRSPGGIDTVARNLLQTRTLIDSLPVEQNGLIAIGDFNASTWSPQLSALRSAGLVEAHDAVGWGRGGTWPDRRGGLPIDATAWGMGIRIDNAFLTPDLQVVDAGVGRHVGSDHRPIWVDLVRTAPDR
jgi:endonuclease/exonuclease/phosphatase (EEP) superfamily protein YafD